MVYLIFTCMYVNCGIFGELNMKRWQGKMAIQNEDFASMMKGIMVHMTKEREDMKTSNASVKDWLRLSTNLKVRISPKSSIHRIMRCFKRCNRVKQTEVPRSRVGCGVAQMNLNLQQAHTSWRSLEQALLKEFKDDEFMETSPYELN